MMAKQALPDADVISEDLKDIPRQQVHKLIEVVTEGCKETAARASKEKSEKDAHCKEQWQQRMCTFVGAIFRTLDIKGTVGDPPNEKERK